MVSGPRFGHDGLWVEASLVAAAEWVRLRSVLLFGVKRKFRTRELYGLPFVLLDALYHGALKGRYKWCEESWVLENNARVNALLPYWDAKVYKRYRAYEKAL